jgi:hypothetical protein
MNALSLSTAAAKVGLSEKRLLGLALRNGLRDPIIVDVDSQGRALIADDWHLGKLAASIAAMTSVALTNPEVQSDAR